MQRHEVEMMRVLVADDHPMIRDAVQQLVESRSGWEVVEQATEGAAALSALARHQPDLAVIDVSMPVVSGLEVVRHAAHLSPGTTIVVLSMHGDPAYAAEALANGALGYVVKQAATRRLLEAIDHALDGQRYVSEPLDLDEVLARLQSGPLADRIDPLDALTPRERETFFLTAAGRSAAETAEVMGISARTVEVHRSHIYDKLELSGQTGLITFAHRSGLLRRGEDT